MLKLDESLLGQRSEPVVREVERGAIRKFAAALGLDDPIHTAVEAARARGYRDLVAPPTFAVTLLPFEAPGLRLPKAGVLHGEQEFEWGAAICAGDRLTVTGWVEDVKTRSGAGGKMHIISVASEAVNQDGERAFRAKAVLIVTEEVEHAVGR